jgi:hypothetical protein
MEKKIEEMERESKEKIEQKQEVIKGQEDIIKLLKESSDVVSTTLRADVAQRGTSSGNWGECSVLNCCF